MDIEEKEMDERYVEGTGQCSTKCLPHVPCPPRSGECDNHQTHQLKDANKSITKAMLHDNSDCSYFYTNTTTTDTTSSTSMLQNTQMSRTDYENIYYQKGNRL